MIEETKQDAILFAPVYRELNQNGLSLLVDPEGPHWITTDSRGADLMRALDGRKRLSEIVANYRKTHRLNWAKAWLDCRSFFQDALRTGFISEQPFHRAPYPGRSEALALGQLTDMWLHVTNACNLSCEHCLVDSSPEGIAGGDTDFWINIINQARALGTYRFYITGGEPFLRSDIFDLIEHILDLPGDLKTELVILTNGMLFRGEHLKRLSKIDPGRIQFQISLDGPTAEINNPMRGNGTFDATIRGIKEVISLGFTPTLTTVVNKSNAGHMEAMVKLASTIGIKNIHLLQSHNRGRAVGAEHLASPSNTELLAAFKETKVAADQAGIIFDNYDVLLGQLLGRSGVKIDLSNAAYESLCVYADGHVYPTAALAGIPALRMGDPIASSLESIWRDSPIARAFRECSVQKKAKSKDSYLKYLSGGGDIEHTYLYSGQLMGEDPFDEFNEKWILDLLFSRAEAKAAQQTHSGFDRPIVYAAMGEDAVLQETPPGATRTGGFDVSLSRSSCVLSVDLDYSRRVVSDFYGDAAETPQPALCCPESYPLQNSTHIPQEVLDISYGCGSPVGLAGIEEKEVMVDLGSGGGIDCFIAAKMVGPAGRVVGIDMTDRMLKQAKQAKEKVVQSLGYNNVDFKKGYLEDIPLPEQFADLVTSNCVINLSPDKKQVFIEIWRVLKDFGRIVVSDTISERPVPEGMRSNPRLWGECVSGALTEQEYIAKMEQAGFYGISILKRTLWKEVEGHRFLSVVFRGYKFEKKAACRYTGQTASYLGPMQAVIDEEGHLFPRDQAIEVCQDTAAKLQRAPYQNSFVITGEALPSSEIHPTDENTSQDTSNQESCCSSTDSCC